MVWGAIDSQVSQDVGRSAGPRKEARVAPDKKEEFVSRVHFLLKNVPPTRAERGNQREVVFHHGD